MYKTVKKVDKEKIVKENIISLPKERNSLQTDNVEDIGEINNSPMIEVGVTKIKLTV